MLDKRNKFSPNNFKNLNERVRGEFCHIISTFFSTPSPKLKANLYFLFFGNALWVPMRTSLEMILFG
jgi:hypothetical protein